MTKAFKLNWHIPVPQELEEGSLADRWTEDGDYEPDCQVKVDDCGFFIHWKSENRVRRIDRSIDRHASDQNFLYLYLSCQPRSFSCLRYYLAYMQLSMHD